MKGISKLATFLLLSLVLVSCSNGETKEKENQKVEEKNKDEKKYKKDSEKAVEKTKVVQEFSMFFINNEESNRELVLSKGDKNDFSIYTLGGNIKVQIGEEKLPLKEAMANGKISVEDLMAKLKFDVSKNIAKELSYEDGGSSIITYPDFSVVKLNEKDGGKDMYFTDVINDLSNFKDFIKKFEDKSR